MIRGEFSRLDRMKTGGGLGADAVAGLEPV